MDRTGSNSETETVRFRDPHFTKPRRRTQHHDAARPGASSAPGACDDCHYFAGFAVACRSSSPKRFSRPFTAVSSAPKLVQTSSSAGALSQLA